MLSYRVMPSVLATRYVLQVTLRGKRLEVRSLESKLTVDGSCDGICEFILCGQLDDYCSIVAFRRYLTAVFSSNKLDVRLNEVSLHPHRSFNSPIRTIQNSRHADVILPSVREGIQSTRRKMSETRGYLTVHSRGSGDFAGQQQ